VQRWAGKACGCRHFNHERALVLGCHSAQRTMHLDPLVIAISGAARVRDEGHLAGRRFQHDLNRIAIPRHANRGVHQNGGHGGHLGHLFAQQEPRHIKVVDRHIAKDAARTFDVIDRRGAGIARGDGDHLDLAKGAFGDLGLDGHEMGVKAAVEADHQHGFAIAHHFQAGFDAVHRQIDGFFAEDRFACPGELLDQVGMGVGGGADHHGVDILGGQDRVNRADIAAVMLRDGLGRRGHGIGHRHQFGPSVRRNGPGMDLSDAARAQ